MSVLPAKYTLTAWEGATFRKSITVLSGGLGSDPMRLVGFSAAMNIRPAPGADPAFTLTSADGGITIIGLAGSLTLFIAATDTATLTSGVYDLSVTAAAGSGDTSALLWGTFRVQGVA